MKVSEMTNEELDMHIVNNLPIYSKKKGPINKEIMRVGFSPSTSCDDTHRAEMALPEGMRERYEYELQLVVVGGIEKIAGARRTPRLFAAITATPRQRAEAMVQALGGGE